LPGWRAATTAWSIFPSPVSERDELERFIRRHCEERSDEAIQNHERLDCFASLAMTIDELAEQLKSRCRGCDRG
jgi:hypothetical protein